MNRSNRRTFLKILSGAAAAAATTLPSLRAFADMTTGQDEFFVFIHAGGGWDVTVWSDPRNEAYMSSGRDPFSIDPATDDVIETTGLRNFHPRALTGGINTFDIISPAGTPFHFGPAIGDLLDLKDRMCLINGISMNTVAHPDGTAYSATGRHLAGGRSAAASIDTMIANEFGLSQLFPSVSVNFPSAFEGPNLDRRATPLRVGAIGTVAKSLTRTEANDYAADRDQVSVVLSHEAMQLAQRSYFPDALTGLAQQYGSVSDMLHRNLRGMFDQATLEHNYAADFDFSSTYQSSGAVNAAFAVEAFKNNVARSVSFVLGGLDTHNSNYATHPLILQDAFDVVAALVKKLDMVAHPTLRGQTLGQHTHVLVVSEFCRTPNINIAGGRDHYPNNSALIISPRFKGKYLLGETDPHTLLPVATRAFVDGMRAITPPDILATFLHAFGTDPRKYMRDGEVVPELLV